MISLDTEKAPEDYDLIREALSGREEAYAELVRRYQGIVARVVERITRRPEWVDDITQQVFLSAFPGLAFPLFCSPSSLFFLNTIITLFISKKYFIKPDKKR